MSLIFIVSVNFGGIVINNKTEEKETRFVLPPKFLFTIVIFKTIIRQCQNYEIKSHK